MNPPPSILNPPSSPSPRQARFSLPLANEVRLVDVKTVRAGNGETSEIITEWAEDHESPDHLPAFDLSLNQNVKRDLYFWVGALRNPEWRTQVGADPAARREAIIADCLLTNRDGLGNQAIHLRSSQLESTWSLSNQQILRLIAAGEIKGVRVGRNWRVNRASAADFLRRRAL